METKTIHIIIRQIEENGEIYYAGRSPELSGLILETDTLKEMMDIATEVADELLLANKEILSENPHSRVEYWENIRYELRYQPMKIPRLQYEY